MNRLKKIAEIPAGSWTKWVVVGFWVVVLVLAFPLSKKLTGAEKNDAKYWLPGDRRVDQGRWTCSHASSHPTSTPGSWSICAPRA